MSYVARCLVLALVAAGFLVGPPAQARMQYGDLEISGQLFNFSEFRWGGKQESRTFNLATETPGGVLFFGPGAFGAPSNADQYNQNINAMRTELLLEMNYHGIPHFTPVLKLRPFWDAAFKLNGKPFEVRKEWQTNLYDGLGDDVDPLVREAYVDVNFHPFFLRAGRQLVSWGRSDGVLVLDVVNPRNFRNPLTFEQERFMIPQWMMNASWDLSGYDWVPGGIQKELQVIWNLEWLPSRFPGFTNKEEDLHPWTLNVVDFANQVINVSEGLFGEDDFFDRNAFEDEGSFFDKNEVFVRWRGRTGASVGPISDMTYSIHYAHLFEDIPFYALNDRINAGLPINIAGPRAIGGGIDFDRHRYDLVGFSFDKALTFLPGQLEGTVFRGEFAYNFGKQYYLPDFTLREQNNFTGMIGLDQYLYLTPKDWIGTPWFVSFQFWFDYISDEAGPGPHTRIGSPACNAQPGCGDEGYILGGATNLFNGLRDQDRSIVTLFMFNDFLPGKTLHVEFFALHEFEEQQATWFRAVVGYNVNTNLSLRVGTNLVSGETDSFFGQFGSNDVAFTEIKYTF